MLFQIVLGSKWRRIGLDNVSACTTLVCRWRCCGVLLSHLADSFSVAVHLLQAILDGLKFALLDRSIRLVLTTSVLLHVEGVDVNRGRTGAGSLHNVAQVDRAQVGGLLEMARGEHILKDFEKYSGITGSIAEYGHRACWLCTLQLFFFFVGVGSINDGIIRDQVHGFQHFRFRIIERPIESTFLGETGERGKQEPCETLRDLRQAPA